MGIWITYSLRLTIKKHNLQKALEIFNYLHTDEMLLKHARGGSSDDDLPVKARKWYSWVSNPSSPYTTVEEAFQNWSIIEIDDKYWFNDDGDFLMEGSYDSKLGQQDFLLQQLACVIEDTETMVLGEYKAWWRIKDGKFSAIQSADLRAAQCEAVNLEFKKSDSVLRMLNEDILSLIHDFVYRKKKI